MFCQQPLAICWLLAALERNVKTKRQKTHTPIQNDTHTHTLTVRFDETTIQHQSSIAVNQNETDFGANASKGSCPFQPFPSRDRCRSWTWSDTFGCWNEEVTSHERLSAREPSPWKSPRLNLLYKLTPFCVRRDVILVGKPVGKLVFPKHLRYNCHSRENRNYYWRKPSFSNIYQSINQPTNQQHPTWNRIKDIYWTNVFAKILKTSPLFCCEEALRS